MLDDPYYLWAVATGWADVFRPRDRSGHDGARQHLVPFVIELHQPDIDRFRRATAAVAMVPKVYQQGRFVTAWIAFDAMAEVLDPDGEAGRMIRRYGLSAPSGSRRSGRVESSDAPAEPPVIQAPILLGVIDSGCPFAHEHWIRWINRFPVSRFASVWDARHAAMLRDPNQNSRPPAALGYGHQLTRTELGALLRSCASGERVDEEAAYVLAGMGASHATELRRRFSHGAHLLDLLAGPLPLRSRMALDPDAPPTRIELADAASDPAKTELAFVQLPNSALQDSSGGWLAAQMLDGLNSLVELARTGNGGGGGVTHVLATMSYGCTTGPHDGTSILEAAIDDLIERQQQAGRPRLEVFMAAGNSFRSGGHAVLGAGDFAPPDAGLCRSTEITWRVLPGSEAPGFLQVWFPKGSDGKRFKAIVHTPSGDRIDLDVGTGVKPWPDPANPQLTAVYLHRSALGGDSPVLLLALAPTEIPDNPDRAPAPHGDWTLAFTVAPADALQDGEAIDLYIARNDRDLGTLLRGRQSYFVDADDEPTRYLRRASDDPGLRDEAEIDPPSQRAGATLRRRGTLNGIATGRLTHVAAGYEYRGQGHAPYSSAGRKRSRDRGRGPNVAIVTDEAPTLRGVRAAGLRSGATFRLVGTSTAAPQWARLRASELAAAGAAGPPTPPPAPPDPVDPEDLWGEGRLPV